MINAGALIAQGACCAPAPIAEAARGGVASCSYRPASPAFASRRSPYPAGRNPARRLHVPARRLHAPAPPRSTAAADADAASEVAANDALLRWCVERHALPPPSLEPAPVDSDLGGGERLGFVASRDVAQGAVLLEIPGDLGVTSVDVDKDPALRALAAGRSELVGLALWLARERAAGAASEWAPLLATLPAASDSPVLWPDEQRAVLLRGSPTLGESRAREAALREEWAAVAAAIAASPDPAAFPPAVLNEGSFLAAMSVVLAHAAYLPSAQCFALLPLVGGVPRTGSAGGATLDYDAARQAVTLVAARPYSRGQEVRLFDGRPNGELLLATGQLENANPADCLTMPAALVPADRLYELKRGVLEELGFGPAADFPIYEDRLATQHLSYMRLARVQDAAQLASVTFEGDAIVSVENEYEVLQLLMGDLRERLQAYTTEYEDDVKDLQRRDLGARERAAAALRLAEKRILRGTMGGVRRRLAPIRGIPTKKGMADPNADFIEMFDLMESIPTAPKRLFDSLRSWARGDADPTWKKK
jgi:histone-lysine N-methyltransferase SETD3